MNRDLHEDNRRSWNEATVAHNSHKADQAKFLSEGGSTLYPEEIDLLGDISGQSLVHLQCNAGQDTLSLAKLGAQVTGVDISDTAIEFAQKLSTDSGIPGTFIRSDIYDWLADVEPASFDIAFASYGALPWLSDLETWASGIARLLKPGGRAVVLEFHPFLGMLEETDDGRITFEYDYMGGGHEVESDGVSDYVAFSGEALTPSGQSIGVQDFQNPHPAHSFGWGVADVVSSMLKTGLQLRRIEEYPYSNGFRGVSFFREEAGKRFYPPEEMPIMPLMLGLVFQK